MQNLLYGSRRYDVGFIPAEEKKHKFWIGKYPISELVHMNI